jgi:hypothetical protein
MLWLSQDAYHEATHLAKGVWKTFALGVVIVFVVGDFKRKVLLAEVWYGSAFATVRAQGGGVVATIAPSAQVMVPGVRKSDMAIQKR